ncbi:hypothetical protein SEVIR_3G119000v4 [Setaria viridis]|uniref:Uncharacterized protein n=2 Tax=Setaria TaxID=4554 RepID=K3Z438_SETIT|nr:uncharacterized protein LOC101773339 [Setaria italica]XP_034585676.1 uncharacterized protein LOC117848391 isoform X2 [Setaria viridis]RCV16175.1 hypothetical protein SETIT_3G116600v2 [Setaria italica]TKW25428.1 hypothetical protein SEVIR_3G119000v2 [Setaria viridis]
MADPDELGRRLAAVGVSEPPAAAAALESSNNNLFQVMRAVEDAEATIRQQLEENSRLKDELMLKTQELHRIRSEATNTNQTSSRGIHQDRTLDSNTNAFSSAPLGSTAESFKWGAGEPMLQDAMRHRYLEATQSNGIPRKFSGDQSAADSAFPSQLSTPSSRSLSPTRHRKEPDYDSRFNLSGQGVLPVSELNSNAIWKQDLLAKVKEHEEEIAQLRRHLSDYSVKETQILNEKHLLEKRIAYMRMAFDQQQQDLVDAASKALSYRQDIIEENIRLTYALQAAHQERSTFVQSLLPLLSEYNLQPSVLDAQSIVSNLKVLFKHLQEKLIITEEKLKESQYQITPWRAESSNNTSAAAQSPSHPTGNALVKANLDIVPQQAYSHVRSPASSPVRARRDWDLLGNESRQAIQSEVATTNAEHDNIGRTSPSTSNHNMKDVPQGTEHDSRAVRFNIESKDQNPSFKDLIRSDASENLEGAEAQIPQEPSAQWESEGSPNLASGLDDANPQYPYLPTVLEEPSSSFSEVAEDDPLPAIDGLRITGEAFPGRELQASGYSINGTTSCNFEWVRHLDDGSVNFIEGARQPTYLVTADDVDSVLAIEVQPLDDRKRKGEIVKVYANDQRKITCDPETKELIKKILSMGHVSYEVLLPVRFLDMWEPAVLAIKREGYSIKCNGQRGVVVTEKFQQSMTINVPYGRPTEFSIVSADGAEYNLKPAENAPSRDAIVLILRLFRMKAVEKSKGRRKGIFFK